MKKNRHTFYLILVMAFFLTLPFTSGCSRAGNSDNAHGKVAPLPHASYVYLDKPGDCPICNMKLVKQAKKPGLVPRTGASNAEKDPAEICIEHNCTMKDCQMHVLANLKPGERIVCPVCGEFIVTTSGKVVEVARAKQSAAMASTGPTVMISPEKQQLIGIRTEPVKMIDLAKIIRASGKIAYDPELVVTQEEFIHALTNEDNSKDSPLKDVVDRAKSLTDAARNKLKLLGMSDDQIAELEKNKKAQTNLYLPGKGENVWAYISVYEYEIGLVKVGASVDLDAVAYPGEIFHGTVVSVSPVLDPATRTNQVRVEVVNTGDKLKPEMFVNAKIKAGLGTKLAVPEAAIIDTGIRKIVYLSKEGDVLESREITVGQKAEGRSAQPSDSNVPRPPAEAYYEVLGGLKDGDIVVTSGNFLVDSESRLKSSVAGEAGHKQHGQ